MSDALARAARQVDTLPRKSKGGRPKTKGISEGWMLWRMLIVLRAFHEAPKGKATYPKRVTSARAAASAAGFPVSDGTARSIITAVGREARQPWVAPPTHHLVGLPPSSTSAATGQAG